MPCGHSHGLPRPSGEVVRVGSEGGNDDAVYGEVRRVKPGGGPSSPFF